MERSAVPALTRAMLIVDLLAQAGSQGLGVSDIAARTGIAKSTTALLCGVLEDEGMARRYDGRYRLGRRFVSLAADYLASADQLGDFYEAVRRQPILARESARVGLLEGTDVLYLARYESAGRPWRGTGAIGDRFPASTTASGKVLLAALPDRVVEDRYRDRVFPRFTERSILSLSQLLDDLARVRERGYSIDDEETNLGQVCLAVTVATDAGEPARLAVSTTLNKERAAELDAGEVVAELRTVAEVFRNPLAGKTL